MEKIKEIIKKYLKKKIVTDQFHQAIFDAFSSGQINDLFEIYDYLKLINKIELFDDFLICYIDFNNITDYNQVIILLDKYNYSLNRRLIITLICLNIINDNNVRNINNDEINKYYDIIKNHNLIKLNLNDLEKNYKNISNKTNDYFSYHCHQIGTIPVLDDYEELSLILAYNNGDMDAYNYLILSNLKLVLSIARGMAYKMDYKYIDDMYQNGIIGLINAINNFDVNSGGKFSTYATSSITRQIKRELLRDRLISIPDDILSDAEKKRKDEEINIALKLAQNQISSLDEAISSDDDDVTLADMIDSSNALNGETEFLAPVEDRAILNQMIEETDSLILSCLTKEEFNIIKSYVFDGLTQKEIVALYALNMTHQNLSLKIEKILKKLHNDIEFRKLIGYLSDDYKDGEVNTYVLKGIGRRK